MDLLGMEGEIGILIHVICAWTNAILWPQTESADEWSYQKDLAGGWIPQDPPDRQYPNICG
jgi:hypothetical protein